MQSIFFCDKKLHFANVDVICSSVLWYLMRKTQSNCVFVSVYHIKIYWLLCLGKQKENQGQDHWIFCRRCHRVLWQRKLQFSHGHYWWENYSFGVLPDVQYVIYFCLLFSRYFVGDAIIPESFLNVSLPV